MNAIDRVISIAENEIGYVEKNTSIHIDSKTEGGGNGNYTKYWRDIKPEYQGQPWCAVFVTWCFVKAFGKAMATKLLKHYPYVYCPTMIKVFDTHTSPKRGNIVVFKRGGEFVHTGIVTSVNGDYFTTIEGNTSGFKAIVANGGAVCQKGYYLSSLSGTVFCTPDYSIVEGDELTMTQYEELNKKIEQIADSLNAAGKDIEELKSPMIYNYMDENVPEWSREAIQWCIDNGILAGVKDDGIVKYNLTNDKIWTLNIIYRLAQKVGVA